MFMRIAKLIAQAANPRVKKTGICITQSGDGALRAPWMRALGASELVALDEIGATVLKKLMRWDDRRTEEFLSAWENVITSTISPLLSFAHGADALAIDGLLELETQVVKTVLGCDFADSTLQIAVRWEVPSVNVICQGLPRALANWHTISNAWLPCFNGLTEYVDFGQQLIELLPIGICPLGYWRRVYERRDWPRRLRQEALAQLSMRAQYSINEL
jgi:hypothetical protein